MVLYVLFIFFIFWAILKSASSSSASCYYLLNKALKTQLFSNISTLYSTSRFCIIRADNSGENYIFGVKKDYSVFTASEVERLYEMAEKAHIHTIVLATYTPISTTSPIYRKVREYGIEVWDYKKLTALATELSSANSSHTYSVLKTSDTSDDTCTIDPSTFDPIQESPSAINNLFSGLFDKPDRL